MVASEAGRHADPGWQWAWWAVGGGNLRQTGLWGREGAKRDKLALDNRGPLPPGDN